MKSPGKLTLLVGLLVPVLAYLLTGSTIPSGLPSSDKIPLRVFGFGQQVLLLTARVHSLVTASHPVESVRLIQDWLILKLQKELDSNLVSVKSIELDGVEALLFDSKANEKKTGMPAILFIHGGGWALNSPEIYAEVTANIAVEANVRVISLRYPLVPKAIYPEALNVVEKAARYLLSNADSLGIDAEKIVISGDSSGGNLAAAVSLKLRDTGAAHNFRSQFLIYPITSALNFLTSSYIDNNYVPMLSKERTIKFVLDYIDEDCTRSTARKVAHNRHLSLELRQSKAFKYLSAFNSAKADHTVTPSKKLIGRMEKFLSDPYSSPMLTHTLKNLPKTYVLTCEYDVLRDDGLAFVKRFMDEDGDNIKHVNVPCFHGALNSFNMMQSGKMLMDSYVQWVREELV